MADVQKDARYQEAVRLFDMWEWGWGMPSDPHARENMRHATGRLACDDENAGQFMEMVVARYLGNKYQDTARAEIQRIAQGAARNVAEGLT